jgi:hypothetical protein
VEARQVEGVQAVSRELCSGGGPSHVYERALRSWREPPA